MRTIDIENIFIFKSRGTLSGVGYEPEARAAGLSPATGVAARRAKSQTWNRSSYRLSDNVFGKARRSPPE